eukprot:765065-Hanusia_phi.AAC.1
MAKNAAGPQFVVGGVAHRSLPSWSSMQSSACPCRASGLSLRVPSSKAGRWMGREGGEFCCSPHLRRSSLMLCEVCESCSVLRLNAFIKTKSGSPGAFRANRVGRQIYKQSRKSLGRKLCNCCQMDRGGRLIWIGEYVEGRYMSKKLFA